MMIGLGTTLLDYPALIFLNLYFKKILYIIYTYFIL
jgi:hypothetical protein